MVSVGTSVVQEQEDESVVEVVLVVCVCQRSGSMLSWTKTLVSNSLAGAAMCPMTRMSLCTSRMLCTSC